jgi:HEAT repeat protein
MQQTTPTQSPTTQAAAPAKPKPPVPPAEFQEGEIATMDAAGLIRILKDPNSPEFKKAKACQRAGELGSIEAVPALAALLSNEHLNTYARYGLEPIADPSVDEALRSSLPKLKGNLLIGVINSLGKRRDAKAGPVLATMIYDRDTDVARAALAALGQVGGVESKKELQAALGKTTGVVKMAAADACLRCAERLLATGQRDEALALYAFLSAPEMPKAARLGAMQGIIREETSTSRPR